MRIPPLLRTVLFCAGGVGLALYAIAEPAPRFPNLRFILRNPLATNGCPGLERQLEAWQRELALQSWSIEIRCGSILMDDDALLGWVKSNADDRRATITVRRGLSVGYQQRVIVHELVHVAVAAGHLWVPAGRDEEDFVGQLADSIYRENRREMQIRILEGARTMRRVRLAREAANV